MKRIWRKPEIDNYVSSLDNLDKKPNSDKKRLLLKISQLYLEIEEYKDALSYTRRYLKLCPNDCKGYKILATVQEKLGCTKEALKSYRRSCELDPRDVESKECVARLYSESEELLFRKKAWLDKMDKELPHSKHTETLRFSVLMESGQTEELERHLLSNIQRDPLNIELHKQLVKVFKKRGDLKETFHYCCSVSKGGAFYKEVEWLQMSLEIMARYCTESTEVSCNSAEQLVRTADWTLSAKLATGDTVQSVQDTWIMYDTCVQMLSQMSHLTTDRRWAQIVQEAQGRLWLHLASLAKKVHGEPSLNEVNTTFYLQQDHHRVGCLLLALSPPPLPPSHPSTELSQHRLSVAGLGVSLELGSHSPTWLSEVISDHCSSLGQLELLSTYLGPAFSGGVSYSANNPIDSIMVPEKDYTPHCVQYIRLRPLELRSLLSSLSLLSQLSTPLALAVAVTNIFPKLKPHAQSLCSLTASDVSQSDICVLLHLINQFPEQMSVKVQALWNELCYHCKTVSVCPLLRSLPTLKSGLWAIRGLSNHGLGPLQSIAMAKYFAHRAALLECGVVERLSVPREKFSRRSGHYWRVAHTTIKQLLEGTYKRPKDPLFTFKQLEKVELSQLQDETGLAVAGVLVNEGKWTDAIGVYSEINSPQAAYNSAQVYLHLAELSNSPSCKNTALENAKSDLALCKDRALDVNDQKLIGLVEQCLMDILVSSMPFVSERRDPNERWVPQWSDLPEQFRHLENVTLRGQVAPTPDIPRQVLNLLDSRETTPDVRKDVRKQLSFSPESTPLSNHTESPRRNLNVSLAAEDDICAKLENLSMNYNTMQQQLGNKNDEVDLLKEQVKILKGEMELLKQNVSQYSSPRATPTYEHMTPQHSGQAIYPPNGYPSPAVMNSPRMGPAQMLPGSPSMVQVVPGPMMPGQMIPGQVVPGYCYPPQDLYQMSPVQPLYPNSQDPGMPLKEALSQASVGFASSTPTSLNLGKEPRNVEEVITPFPGTGVPRPKTPEAVFDPSVLPSPKPLDICGDWGGKFSKDIPAVLITPVINTAPGPGYFSSLLQTKPVEEAVVITGGYESPEEVDNLSFSQHFSTGAFTGSPDKLQRSTSSHCSDLELSHFTPLVSLEEVENFVTGEEDEETLYECRAKLFRFDHSGEWKHRGIGEIKILVNRKTKVPRLIMRRDFVLNICANHVITPNMTLSPAMGSSKAWLWFTACDLTHDEPEPQQLAARFKSEDIANDFKEAFERCRDREGITNIPTATDEDDLVITYVKQATSEDQANARKWLLPDNFYSSAYTCPGCIGCESVEKEEEEDEVTFIKEVLPPTPIKQKAMHYQLPPSFYNSRNTNCRGCIGCEETSDIHETPTPLDKAIEITYEKGGVNDDLAAKYQLPPTFYNISNSTCSGCLGCEKSGHEEKSQHDQSLDDSVQITYESVAQDPEKAALYHLPPTFYNTVPPCAGCAGCEGCVSQDQQESIDASVKVTYERPASDASKADYYQLPRNFFDTPIEKCAGCLGCEDYVEEEEEDLVDPVYEEEEEEYTSYGGCGRSDPNEPISEKPLYDDLWPEDITEEDKGQFFTTKEQEGEEETEMDIFSDHCVLLQHDPRCGGYKEHGPGTMSIKSHTERVQFRILFRSDAAGKICANHAIEGGMFIEPTRKTEGYVWFVPIDYSDPETPKPERFVAQFEDPSKMKAFVDLFKQCSTNMKGHSVNHKLVSLLAAGSPRKDKQNTSINDTSYLVMNQSELSSNVSVNQSSTSSTNHTPDKQPLMKTPPKQELDPCVGLKKSFEQEFCSDDINIIKESLPPPEFQELEVKYQLPRGFYNYLTSPRCEGCTGCEDPLPLSHPPATRTTPIVPPDVTTIVPPAVTPIVPPVISPTIPTSPVQITPTGVTTFGISNTTPTSGLHPTTPQFGLTGTNTLYNMLPQMDPSNQYGTPQNTPATPQFGLMQFHHTRTNPTASPAAPQLDSKSSRNLFGSPQQNINIFAQNSQQAPTPQTPASPSYSYLTPQSSETPLNSFTTPPPTTESPKVNPFTDPYISPTDEEEYEEYGDYSSDSEDYEDYEAFYNITE